MTLREMIEDSDASYYIANDWANINLYFHGELIEMNEKYLDCEVKDDFSISYDYDHVTEEINFDSIYVDVELADDVVI